MKPCQHSEHVAGCRICHLVATKLKYAKHYGQPIPATVATTQAAPRRVALPCVHEGSALTGAEREVAGLPHAKHWFHCNHPDAPKGPHVCKCKGCGSKCSGYVADVGTTSAGVPKVIHHIWLGSTTLPDEFARYRATWQTHFPDWQHRLWTDADDYSWMRNERQFREAPTLSGRSDWLRYELLNHFGGVYVDTDFECLKPFEDLIDGHDCWSASDGMSDCVSVGIMGAKPGHPLFARLVEHQPAWDLEHADETPDTRSGPGYFTAVYNRYVADGNPRIKVFAPELMYPYTFGEKHRKGEKFPHAVAVHHWAASWQTVDGPPVGKRHLIYHLLPVGNWRAGVDELRKRWSLFTGRKIVAVMTGTTLRGQGEVHGNRTQRRDVLQFADPATVRDALPPDAEIVELPNDPDRWELVSWPVLWESILSTADPLDAVLWAHSKGVTRPKGSPCQEWARLLYGLNLDHWSLVEEQLRRHPICGAFLKEGKFFGTPSDQSKWHYSGNFWWGRVSDFRWPGVPVPADKWGAEAWIGIAYRSDEAGRIGPLVGHRAIDLYDPKFVREIALPAHANWLKDNPAESSVSVPVPTDRIRLSIVVPTTGRESIGRTLESITGQLLPGDEVIVQRDATGDWGATPRTRGQQAATGTHVLWMDDDDTYRPGALQRVRDAIAKNPTRPHLFRLHRNERFRDVLWRTPVIQVGNVSTQMFVVPNEPAKFGDWGSRYEGDFDFIASTLAKFDSEPVWADDVIAEWRPRVTGDIGNPDHAMPPPWWSHDPGDEYCFAELVGDDDYGLASLDLRGASVLDIGGHCGTFAFAARTRGASLIHCYEPEPSSLRHLTMNARRMPGVTVFPEAIGDVIDAKWFRSKQSITDRPFAVTLDHAIGRMAALSPTHRIDLIKIDCEGGEWPALSQVTRLDLVDRIVGEWHVREWQGRTWSRDDIARLLTPHGFEVTYYEPRPVVQAACDFGLFRAVRSEES